MKLPVRSNRHLSPLKKTQIVYKARTVKLDKCYAICDNELILLKSDIALQASCFLTAFPGHTDDGIIFTVLLLYLSYCNMNLHIRQPAVTVFNFHENISTEHT